MHLIVIFRDDIIVLKIGSSIFVLHFVTCEVANASHVQRRSTPYLWKGIEEQAPYVHVDYMVIII